MWHVVSVFILAHLLTRWGSWVYDLHSSQPLGGDQDVLALLLRLVNTKPTISGGYICEHLLPLLTGSGSERDPSDWPSSLANECMRIETEVTKRRCSLSVSPYNPWLCPFSAVSPYCFFSNSSFFSTAATPVRLSSSDQPHWVTESPWKQ